MAERAENRGVTHMLHYVACGLPFIWLINGFYWRESSSGKSAVIPGIPNLHRAIGEQLVKKQGALTGNEVRFFRIEMNLSQKELALMLGTSEITVRKWEKSGCTQGPARLAIKALYSEMQLNKPGIVDLANDMKNNDEPEHVEDIRLYLMLGEVGEASGQSHEEKNTNQIKAWQRDPQIQVAN